MRGPELTLHNVTVELNEEINAWTFVTECSEDNATVRYVEKPDFSVPGSRKVSIEAVDSKGKRTVKDALLRVSIVKQNLALEADGQAVELSDLLVPDIDASMVSFVYKPITLNHVGDYEVKLLYQGVEYDSEITVEDHQAPVVTWKESVTTYQNHDFDPMTAVEQVTDATDVTAGIKGKLDTETLGDYPVTITVTDEGGNQTETAMIVSVIADQEPPVLQGITDKQFFAGETISYMEGISAQDAVDGVCQVQVDHQAVNEGQEGSYEVIYTAKDQSGNESSQTAVFTITKISADEEALNQRADEVLKEITDDTMSLSRKAYAVYSYAYSNIAYTGTSDKSDWMAEAYRGLNEGNGDCFTYFAVCKILLQRLGIDTMDVQRTGGTSEHYWLMVNLGTGWYHFDATRRKVYFDGFMARDEDVQAYTAKVGDHYYDFDHSAYPATPTEKFILQ